MKQKIFLSYAREDRGLVPMVQRTLRNHGIVAGNDVVIVDPHQDLKAGMNVRKMIKEQISASSKVVIIVSNHSANSVWVNYEAGMAAALGKPIVVIGKKGSEKTASMLSAVGNVRSIEIDEKGRSIETA